MIGSLWFLGDHGAVALVTILSGLTLHEFYGLMERMGFRPFHRLGLAFGVLMTSAPYYLPLLLPGKIEAESIATLLLALGVLVACIRILGERDPSNRVETISATFFGLLFVPFMLHFIVRILTLGEKSGLLLCVWLVAVSKFCDVGALLTGLAIGRHKMAPLISPKKTWEGAVGGVLTSAALGAGLATLFAGRILPALTPLVAAAVAVPIAIATIVSDLVESAIKRRADAKDTSAMIPGIGGAFDLTDSLILTSPLAYLIFRLLA